MCFMMIVKNQYDMNIHANKQAVDDMHRQVIFMLVLIWSTCQQTLVDREYDRMVRQHALTLDKLKIGYVRFMKDILQQGECTTADGWL